MTCGDCSVYLQVAERTPLPGVLTVYAVQFRYDADPSPLELDRCAFNEQVHTLVLHVEQLLG